MNFEGTIYPLVGLGVLYLVIRFLKLPIRIIIDGLFGIILLFITCMIGDYLGFEVPINAISLFISAILGAPGIIFLLLFQFFSK